MLLATLGDLASAQVLAARLESAGIVVRLRGESLGPYRMTVGAMAATEVWVTESDLEEARELLDKSGLAEPADLPPSRAGRLPTPEALVLGALSLILVVLLVRLLLLP